MSAPAGEGAGAPEQPAPQAGAEPQAPPELLLELLRARGPSGYEGRTRRCVAARR